MAHRRTGLRKPLNHLKTWGDDSLTRRLTPRLSVGVVDEELPFGKEGGRKSWYITVTQDTDLLRELGPVRGAPEQGKTLLLFEDDAVALVQHLCQCELVGWDSDAGRFVNEHARLHDEDRAAVATVRRLKRQRRAKAAKKAKQKR